MAIISECIVIPDVFYDQQTAEKEDRKAIVIGMWSKMATRSALLLLFHHGSFPFLAQNLLSHIKTTSLTAFFFVFILFGLSQESGKVVIVLAGRHAGKKAVVIKTFEDGNSNFRFSHCFHSTKLLFNIILINRHLPDA